MEMKCYRDFLELLSNETMWKVVKTRFDIVSVCNHIFQCFLSRMQETRSSGRFPAKLLSAKEHTLSKVVT